MVANPEPMSAEEELRATRARMESEKAQRRLAETLREVGNFVNATLDIQSVYERALVGLEQLIPYERAALLLDQGMQVKVVARRDRSVARREEETGSIAPDTLQRIEAIQSSQRPLLAWERLCEGSHQPEESGDWLGIPLIYRGEIQGLFILIHQPGWCYTEREAEIGFTYASQVVSAIENARLFETERQRARELAALRATSADITAVLEPARLLKAILERAIHLLNAHGGELALYERQANLIQIAACHNMVEDYTGRRMRLGEGALGHVIATHKPILISDYQTWHGHLPKAADWPYHGVVAVPMLVHERVVGALAVTDATGVRQFEESDLELLTLFAQQAAIAIENAQLFDEMQAALKNTQTLYQIARSLIATENIVELLQGLVDAVAEALPASGVILTTIDPDESAVTHCVVGGPDADRVSKVGYKEFWEGPSGPVLHDGKPVFGPATPANHHQPGRENQEQAVIIVPLQYRGQIFGTLSAMNPPDGQNFTQTDVDLLLTIASHASVAIETAQLFERVQRLAETDDLTGINNRRQLFKLGDIEFARARRYPHPLAAIMLDIDDFKTINDTNGHSTGDDVLRGLADICTKNIREIDILSRYGGEEFVILLPATSIETAAEIAERLRKTISQNAIPTRIGALNISISLGVTEMTEKTANLAALIDRADTALYVAKRAGKNRVEVVR